MVYKYLKTDARSLLHPHLFISMMMMGVFNMIFFVFDTLTFRFPTTGLLTSWCASIQPNRPLVFIYIGQLLSTYWSMLFTLLFCVIRLIVFWRPSDHRKYTRIVFPIYSSIAFLLPFLSPYFMYSAKGYCRQWENVFEFGQVYISYFDTLNGIRHDKAFLPVTIGVPLLVTIVNLLFAVCAIKYSKNPNIKTKLFDEKAKLSLFLTNLAMTIPYLAHCVLTLLSIFVEALSPYSIIIRTPLTDIAHLSVIVFYWRSHQIFNGKQSANVIQPASSLAPQVS